MDCIFKFGGMNIQRRCREGEKEVAGGRRGRGSTETGGRGKGERRGWRREVGQEGEGQTGRRREEGGGGGTCSNDRGRGRKKEGKKEENQGSDFDISSRSP